MIKPFLDDNFLLQNKTAEKLYHDHAEALPIIDYHNHLPPDEIANDKIYENITQVWLAGDHYKWRAMRANGVPEKYITGDAGPKEKFIKWAETVPYTMRNPLFHWTHLELSRYFGITDILSAKNAEEIYERTTAALQGGMSAKTLLRKMKVEVVCTTDYPTDSLEFHQKESESSDSLKMLPTFRPDKFLSLNQADYPGLIKELEVLTNIEIQSFDDLVKALEQRIDFFHALGGRLSDHGLTHLHKVNCPKKDLDKILLKSLKGEKLSEKESAGFQTELLQRLGEIYYDRGWTMQLHLGALRNNNTRLLQLVGADVGADSIGDYPQGEGLSFLLNNLDKKNKAPKTILYNLNPRDNELFAAMTGNFNDGSIPGKIQWGSAWWFLDQKDGMEKQLNALSNLGLLSRFVGMLTDSRSFLSFPRHEYFRRILCNLIGTDVENGELPNDEQWLGQIVQDICYRNAKNYFAF